MSSTHDPNQNHLLAALLDAEFGRLAPHLELIPMLLGDVLYESGGKLQHVYFPTTSIVSLHYVLENGGSSEIAGVGTEIAELRTELKTEIDSVRAELKAGNAELRTELKAEIAETRKDLLKWIIGAIGFQTVVILGALISIFIIFAK